MSALARTPSPDLREIHADVWHASALAQSAAAVLATGDTALDAQLPGGGWPIGALTEILQPPDVHNEWRLLLPALAHSGAGPVVLVGAPHAPYAPGLAAQGLAMQRLLWVCTPLAAQRLWACEQALRCAEVQAVLAWLPQARSEQLRRLQMAAAEHAKLLFVMRPAERRDEASPAILRLHIQPLSRPAAAAWTREGSADTPAPHSLADGLQIQLLKRRGPPLEQPLHLQARTTPMRLLLAASQAHALDRATAPA